MAKNTLITFIIVLSVVAVGVFYFGYQKGYGVGYKKGEEVGWATAQVGAGEAVTNPLEKMPSTNPFAETVNPFKELYKNPFK
ncbi:MAG: hypothetical protein ACE5GI_04040 [Candidatus Aminicenantales bacterium]